MAQYQSVNAISNGFLSPTLTKKMGKLYCTSIQDTHHILIDNSASIKSRRSGVQNGHLGIVLREKQYSLVRKPPFVCPTDPDRMSTIPVWKNSFDKKALIREHNKHRRKYEGCIYVETAHWNQLLMAFEDTYLLTLKNGFTGYLRATTLLLLRNLYGN